MWKFLLCSKKMGRTITEQPSSQSRTREPLPFEQQESCDDQTSIRGLGCDLRICILATDPICIFPNSEQSFADSFCALSVDYYSGVCQQNFLPRLTFVILGYPVLWCQSREQKLFVFVPIWSSSAFYIWNVLGQWTHDCSMSLIWKYTFTFWNSSKLWFVETASKVDWKEMLTFGSFVVSRKPDVCVRVISKFLSLEPSNIFPGPSYFTDTGKKINFMFLSFSSDFCPVFCLPSDRFPIGRVVTNLTPIWIDQQFRNTFRLLLTLI